MVSSSPSGEGGSAVSGLCSTGDVVASAVPLPVSSPVPSSVSGGGCSTGGLSVTVVGEAVAAVVVAVTSVVASPGAETFGPPIQEVRASAPANIAAARLRAGRRVNWGKYVVSILLRYDGKTRFYRV